MTVKTRPIAIQTPTGQQEIELSVELYHEAAELGMSLPTLMNLRYPSANVELYGTAFQQAAAQAGLFLSQDVGNNITPPTIQSVFNGTNVGLSSGAIVRPDGADRNTPAGRLLFPAVLLDLLESSLRDDRESYNAAFLRMVAYTRTITSPRYDQVVIDYVRPRAARGMPITQGSEPQRMLSIKTSQISRTMPVYALGMEWTKEAMAASTLDLVAIAVREHALEERSDQLYNDFMNIVNGSVDAGESGIIGAAFTAASLDASIVANGVLSQKAWVKFLRKDYRKKTLRYAVCDLDTYLAIQNRTGRPTVTDQSTTDERLNATPKIMLPGIPGAVEIFPMEGFPANTIVAFDPDKAMRRMVYSGADYDAIQEFVLRKTSAMRFDWSERIETLGYPEAFSTMTLTV